jgi:5-methylcytosine-specific restriction enzyme A
MPKAAQRFKSGKYTRNKFSPYIKYSALYSKAAWKELRLSFLKDHPLCAECAKEGVVKFAKVVDHIKSHKGDSDRFFDLRNLQALCKRHHDKKTYLESIGVQ